MILKLLDWVCTSDSETFGLVILKLFQKHVPILGSVACFKNTHGQLCWSSCLHVVIKLWTECVLVFLKIPWSTPTTVAVGAILRWWIWCSGHLKNTLVNSYHNASLLSAACGDEYDSETLAEWVFHSQFSQSKKPIFKNYSKVTQQQATIMNSDYWDRMLWIHIPSPQNATLEQVGEPCRHHYGVLHQI